MRELGVCLDLRTQQEISIHFWHGGFRSTGWNPDSSAWGFSQYIFPVGRRAINQSTKLRREYHRIRAPRPQQTATPDAISHRQSTELAAALF
jgi:hypothetical protein